MTIRNDIILEDTTLRDGEQAPGVAMNREKKLTMLAALVEAGVAWIEVGIPKMGGEELEYVKDARRFADRARLIAWNRGVREDVAFSLGLGYDAVHIGLPTSDIHLDASVSKTREWVTSKATDLIKFAKDSGAFVSISAEDMGRTEPAFLQHYAGVVAEAGADRLRLSDTVGILSPEGYYERVSLVRAAADIDLQCHCHNDYGLAVANTLAGLKAGARYFHVCVNSMGERAGMPDLAQMVMALKHLYGVDTGVDTTKLTGLSQLLDKLTGVRSEPWRPVVGDNVFAHESGIHSNGILKSGSSFEPMAPEEVGGLRRIVIGKHTGRAAIQHVLARQGVEVDPDLLQACLGAVRQASIGSGGEIAPAELVSIYARLSKTTPTGAI